MPVPAASPLETLVRQKAEDEDPNGNRLIRHVGKGALLTSRVDGKGRLLRQELLLGQDFVVWQHGTRIRTGVCLEPDRPEAAQYDVHPSRSRLERARQAAESYLGKDRYVKHLSRVLVLTAGLGMAGAEVVTVSEDAAAAERARQRVVPGGGLASRRNLGLAVSAMLVVVLLYWIQHHQ
jgi:hypothetical protein